MTIAIHEPVASPRPAPVDDALVRIDHLGKAYPKRRRLREALAHPRRRERVHALRGFSCSIREGELFGLLGPNGAGKSTLFRLLATLVLPDEGTAAIAGSDLRRDAAQVRRLVAFVNAEERSLNWRLSALENLRLHATLYGLRGRARTERIDEVLAIMELETARSTMVGHYSTGMKQRLLIARALLSRPAVLLLDEPTRSLDPLAARRFRRLLRDELVARQRCTVLLATHDAEESMSLCDRVAVLREGRLVALGDASELARSVGGARFCATTRDPEHPAFRRLVAEGRIANLTRRMAPEGCVHAEFDIEGGRDYAAGVLRTLVTRGAELSAFRELEPSLADVLERCLLRPPPSGDVHA